MNTRITLVNPPYPIGSHKHPPFTPLGLGYLASVLEKSKYDVNIIDCQALDIKNSTKNKQISLVSHQLR